MCVDFKSNDMSFYNAIKIFPKIGFSKRTLLKNKTLIKKHVFSISKSMKFTFIMQLEYCQKLEFEADPINKLTPLIKKTVCFDIKSNEISFYNAIKILPNLGFRSGLY